MACSLVTINNNKGSTRIAIIVIVFTFLLMSPNTQAQTNIAFKPADKFLIPTYNGSISFAVNGTYFNATFENNTWTFTNLFLTESQPLENFEISTQNSNVTIFSYLTSNSTFASYNQQRAQLSYVVEGQGKQILNLGLGSEEEGWEWVVRLNNHVIGEGDGWNILRDGTMVVTGATGNVTISHYRLSDSSGNNVLSSNLPFSQQYSVAIITAMLVAITVVIAIVVKVKNREQSGEK
jgi:hypothetical protein